MKRFKILTAVILAVSLLMVFTPFAAASEEVTFESAYATIVKVSDEGGFKTVLIKTDAVPSQEIVLKVNDDTILLDNETREAADFASLKEGGKIIATYSKLMSKSQPPQTNCLAIVTNVEGATYFAHYMGVASITEIDDGIKFLNTAKDYVITVNEDTLISNVIGVLGFTPDMIKEGDTVFAFFAVAATSYPAQAHAYALVIADGAVTKPVAPIATIDLTAKPTAATVIVNGEEVAFDAYNILGNNYFKLRDLAFKLSGTDKQFDVGYDNKTKAITLTSGEKYTVVGGEMTGKGEGDKMATFTKSVIYLDDEEVSIKAYLIEGNNYFMLRDIGAAFDFGVEWDAATKTITIDTTKEYTPE